MSNTRAIAATVIDSVIHGGRNTDAAFSAAGADQLEARERAFVRAQVYGTLRTHLRNRYILQRLLERPLRRRDLIVEALLSNALFALTDSPQPDYAVVSASVDATRALGRPGMRGLVNALLRRFLRERDDLLAAAHHDAEARWLHPAWLLEQLQQDWPEDWQRIVEAGNQQAPMWLRINLARTTRENWLARLSDLPISAGVPVSQLPAAVLLDAPVAVDSLPGFSAGDCSVQDAASQWAALLLDVQPGMRVLDACAAPGGKTAHILEAVANQAKLTALDESAARLQRVEDNLQRLQLSADVLCGDALQPQQWWDGEPYDRILVDAPCSATGVLRRHPDIRYLRRATDIETLQRTQQALLQALWKLLQPGGLLLYSTCSVLRAENDAVVAAFTAGETTARVLPLTAPVAAQAAVPAVHGVHVLPGQQQSDGFYYALMERVAG